MKITMKDFKENAIYGVATGIAVTGVLYFLNKAMTSELKKSNDREVNESEAALKQAQSELEDLKIKRITK